MGAYTQPGRLTPTPSNTTLTSSSLPLQSTNTILAFPMSLLRALITAGPSVRVVATRVAAPRTSALLAHRLISTSPCRHAVDPHAKRSETHDYLPELIEPRSPSIKTAMFTAADEPGTDFNPYKDGPSAIDKAVHLFFFTEIIRGASPMNGSYPRPILKPSAQACGSSWSRSSGHPTRSCILSRKGPYRLASVESML